ncbi:acyltransferase family protein [Cellulomonas composti]|uniref:Acyltransferase 3 domain-containing protein n=1 Tax=Cellulomonas composti TaxID=266130 RepID=A0A511JB77_9CELL|nr:acyltransferase [Cellulomonas composti]GEL94963.1 hypothetical protein CCO02nite_16210 [Cellulomonas composti]
MRSSEQDLAAEPREVTDGGAAGAEVAPAAPPAARVRMEWMDTLRGTAILLMLLWHATSLPRIEGVAVPAAVVAFNDALLPYRMPTLMFLSGLLLPRSLNKPLGQYYRGKIALIWWPYFVWALVFFAIKGTDYPLWNPHLYIATSYLWFLFYIGCYYLVAPLLRRVPAAVPPLVCLVGAALVDAPQQHRMLFYAVFFFGGAWAVQTLGDLPTWLRGRRVLVAVMAVLAFGFAVASGINRDVNYRSLFVPLSVAGILVAVVVAARLGHRWTGRLRHVGRNSIVYYTSHFPVMLGAVAVLVELRAPWWVMIPALWISGLVVGAVLASSRDRVPVRWLFEAPFLLGRTRSGRSAGDRGAVAAPAP